MHNFHIISGKFIIQLQYILITNQNVFILFKYYNNNDYGNDSDNNNVIDNNNYNDNDNNNDKTIL